MAFEHGAQHFLSPSRGTIEHFDLAAPAAGAAMDILFDIDFIYLPISLTWRFVTDANVQDRLLYIYLQETAAGSLLNQIVGATALTDTKTYNGGACWFYSNDVVSGLRQMVTMPLGYLPGLGVLTVGALNIQAGDQFDLGHLTVQKWRV